MLETLEEYKDYLQQIERIIHPNLFSAFLKIHNKIVEESVNEAKQFKPAKEWVELKTTIEAMKGKEVIWRKMYLKQILKQIDQLPGKDSGW